MGITKRFGCRVFTVLACGLLITAATAGPPNKPPPSTGHTPVSGTTTSQHQSSNQQQQASNHQLVEALQQLHTVEHVLASADHDYGGHRVSAMRDIHEAVEQLKQALKHGQAGHHSSHASGGTGTHSTATSSSPSSKVSGTHSPNTGESKSNSQPESQQASDQQLTNAISQLNHAINLLRDSSHDYGGHREKAVHDLQRAVEQIQKAIAYSKKQNQQQP
jgi:hypothetical protein